MTTPREAIRVVLDRLVDDEIGFEFTTWTEDKLFEAFVWALHAVASRAKGQFTSWKRIQLQPGDIQTPAECDEILAVGAVHDRYGREIADLHSEVPLPPGLKSLARCRCQDDGEYTPFSLEITDPQHLMLWPPVPDAGYQLQVQCFSVPEVSDLDTDVRLPSTVYSAILEAMMYYAHMYDLEAVPSRDRAQRHWDVAMQLLEVV